MILVRSHRPRLSGNKLMTFVLLSLIAFGACTPRAKVMVPRSTSGEEPDAPVVITDPEEPAEVAPASIAHQIALLLPFELNRLTGGRPTEADIKRAALALDFYQGFELGLEKVTAEGGNFRLEVLDSRDDELEVARLARSVAVREAHLVVGPIFPKSIKAFADNAGLNREGVLQVSPLAATMPSEFNLPNLVSITSPIMVHVRALAKRIEMTYRRGDVILLYRTDESSSQQFLPPLKEELRLLGAQIVVREVHSEEELLEHLRTEATNLVVCGSTNRFRVMTIADQLRRQMDTNGYQIRLFGHPNWAKLDFSTGAGLERLETEITSSFHIAKGSGPVREFEKRYLAEFGVAATEFAYKGYDAGCFFGELLLRHGDDYHRHLTNTLFEGLHNSFDFQYNPQWGYVNEAIHFLVFRQGEFSRTN